VVSRAAEVESIAATLGNHRTVLHLGGLGATLEGGDVLRIGRTLYVGRSRRTNDPAIQALRRHLEPLDYRIEPVAVEACLHLKTGCSYAGGSVVVVNPQWVEPRVFEREGLAVVAVAPSEPWAANVLRVGDALFVSTGHRHTEARLRQAGLDPVEIEIGEFQKAEAGLTCLSLLIPPPQSVSAM
jgi:dimethylargininase